MTTSFRRETAKLYVFPTRTHLAAGPHREDMKPASMSRTPQVCETSFGSGWYHEAAIQDSDRARKP